MKGIILISAVSSMSASFTAQLKAQGCSYAGFCSIHSLKTIHQIFKKNTGSKNKILAVFSFGKGERSTSVYTPYLEYTGNISNQTSVTGK